MSNHTHACMHRHTQIGETYQHENIATRESFPDCKTHTHTGLTYFFQINRL